MVGLTQWHSSLRARPKKFHILPDDVVYRNRTVRAISNQKIFQIIERLSKTVIIITIACA